MDTYTISWYPNAAHVAQYENCTNVDHDPTRNTVTFDYKGARRTLIGGAVQLIRTSSAS